jgi:hypothetical protein
MREGARSVPNHDTARVGRSALGVVTVAVVSAMIGAASPAIAATQATAGSAGNQQVSHHHHAKHHPKHHPKRHKHHKAKVALKAVTVDGIVTATHGRHISIYATSAKVGHHTTHDSMFHFVLGRKVRHSNQFRRGYVVHLVAAASGPTKGLVIRTVRKRHVAPSPATLIVGHVDRVSAGELVVSQLSRDDGRHDRGSQRHPLSVDVSQAKITVDGAAGTVHAGDFVAVLGETNNDSVLASRVYDISGEAESLRGQVVAVNSDAVTVRSEGFDTTVSLGSGDNEIPLFIDGGAASADQLRVHDRIVVLGVVSEEEEGFVPVLAFGFDHNNHHPCGDNPLPRHHQH